MAPHGKSYKDATGRYDREKQHAPEEAFGLVKSLATKKFDETVEVAIRLGVDPRKADQMVRGAVVLPNGLGKTVRVLVFAKGEKAQESAAGKEATKGGESASTSTSRGSMRRRMSMFW